MRDRDRCYRSPSYNDPRCEAIAARLRGEAIVAMLDDANCFPPGVLAEVAAVLRHGQAKYSAASPAETGGGQTREDHIRHAIAHVYGAAMGDESEPHIAHAIARLALARGLELAAAGGGGHYAT
jgi:hypothetical protein